MRTLRAILSLSFAVLLVSTSLGQQLTLQRLDSGANIELQPQSDHHRIHFQLRIRSGSGKTFFARVETKPVSNASGHQTLCELRATTNDETWDCYLRVPKNVSETCEYKLLFGEVNSDNVDKRLPIAGFRWIVERSPNGSTNIKIEENGNPLPIQITIRKIIQSDGGSFRIVSESKVFTNRFSFRTVQDQADANYGLTRIR